MCDWPFSSCVECAAAQEEYLSDGMVRLLQATHDVCRSAVVVTTADARSASDC